jgi:hypothetical protein
VPRRDPERAREAAEELTNAAAESYRIVVERAFTARESTTRLSRDFFEEGMDLAAEGVEQNIRTTRRLAEVARRQSETFRELSEGSRDAYTGFLDSLSDYGDEERRQASPGGEDESGGEPDNR